MTKTLVLSRDMFAIEESSSRDVSLTSQFESCNRFRIMGPTRSISDPDNVFTSSARFGAKNCSIDNCANFNASTAN